ncbi:hypothetical protein BDZ89DRAFT_1230963 [Hymenopellis radicata]|nr:hypothetical protein BDZ89DRAFT_1230963 [Hymenopellis radicata]
MSNTFFPMAYSTELKIAVLSTSMKRTTSMLFGQGDSREEKLARCGVNARGGTETRGAISEKWEETVCWGEASKGNLNIDALGLRRLRNRDSLAPNFEMVRSYFCTPLSGRYRKIPYSEVAACKKSRGEGAGTEDVGRKSRREPLTIRERDQCRAVRVFFGAAEEQGADGYRRTSFIQPPRALRKVFFGDGNYFTLQEHSLSVGLLLSIAMHKNLRACYPLQLIQEEEEEEEVFCEDAQRCWARGWREGHSQEEVVEKTPHRRASERTSKSERAKEVSYRGYQVLEPAPDQHIGESTRRDKFH